MPYSVEWHIPDRVLLLSLTGIVTVDDAIQSNREIEQALQETTNDIFLLIDAQGMRASVPFERIRQEQTFVTNPRLQAIYVVATSKLTRLLLTVVFFATTATFRLFDNIEQAERFLQRHLDRCDC